MFLEENLIDIDRLDDVLHAFFSLLVSVWIDLYRCIGVFMCLDVEHVSIIYQLLENIGTQSVIEEWCDIV